MTRSVLRMFVVLATALYLFAGADGGDVQAYECWHMGFDCDGQGCGWNLPAAPTRSYQYFCTGAATRVGQMVGSGATDTRLSLDHVVPIRGGSSFFA